jgi:hypothetical protein
MFVGIGIGLSARWRNSNRRFRASQLGPGRGGWLSDREFVQVSSSIEGKWTSSMIGQLEAHNVALGYTFGGLSTPERDWHRRIYRTSVVGLH